LDSVGLAQTHLARSWRLYPRGETAAVALAETLDDDPESQMSLLMQALASLPESPRLWRLRGAAAMRLGDMDGAVEAYDNALAYDDSTAARLRDLGVALFYSGQTAEAVGALRESFARDSTDATTLRVYGFAAHAENESDLALDLLARAADALKRQALAELYQEIARTQKDVLRDDAALASIELAERLAPDDPTMVLNRAALLQQMGRLDAAERGYREFLERAPEAAPALRSLAQSRAEALETIRLNRIEADLRRRLNE
jgi:tetratricopeptide (TPR) repeat protein